MTCNPLSAGQSALDPSRAIRYPHQAAKRAKDDQGDPLIISGHKKEVALSPHADPRQHCKTDCDPVLPLGSTGFIPCESESAEDQIEAEKSN